MRPIPLTKSVLVQGSKSSQEDLRKGLNTQKQVQDILQEKKTKVHRVANLLSHTFPINRKLQRKTSHEQVNERNIALYSLHTEKDISNSMLVEYILSHLRSNQAQNDSVNEVLLGAYLPQLCALVLDDHHNALKTLLLSTCTASLSFAHALIWCLQAYTISLGAPLNMVDIIIKHAVAPAVLMQNGLCRDELDWRQPQNMLQRRYTVFSDEEAVEDVFETDAAYSKYLTQRRNTLLQELVIDRERGLQQEGLVQLTPNFIQNLYQVATIYSMNNQEDATIKLRKELQELQNNTDFSSNVLYLPIGNTSHRVRSIHVEESFAFVNASHNSYYLCVEVTDFAIESLPTGYTAPAAENMKDMPKEKRSKSVEKNVVDSNHIRLSVRMTIDTFDLAEGCEGQSHDETKTTLKQSVETDSILENEYMKVKSSRKFPKRWKLPRVRKKRVPSAELSDTTSHAVLTPLSNHVSFENSRLFTLAKNKIVVNGEGIEHSKFQIASPASTQLVIEDGSPESLGSGRPMAKSLDFTDPDAWTKYCEDTQDNENHNSDDDDSSEDDENNEALIPRSPPPQGDHTDNVLSEQWAEKCDRIRQGSEYGQCPGWRLLPVLVRTNDMSLRKEQFTMQLILLCHNIFQKYKLPLTLTPYSIVTTTPTSGLMEILPDTIALSTLKANDSSYTSLKVFFHRAYGPRKSQTFRRARKNFVESLAAYCIVFYLFQVSECKDENILLRRSGHLIPINLSAIFSLENEIQTPFYLPNEFIDVLGGPHSKSFSYFRGLCTRGYLALRRDKEDLLVLIDLAFMSNDTSEYLPFVSRTRNTIVQGLLDRLQPTARTSKCQKYLNQLIDESVGIGSKRWYDKYQQMYHKQKL